MVKTLDEKIKEDNEMKEFEEVIKTYSSYLYEIRWTFSSISEHMPQALSLFLTLVGNLEKFGECKNLSTIDPRSLEQCIEEYTFKSSLMKGIADTLLLEYTPERIKEFMDSLKTLEDEQVIKGLYNLYKKVKEISLEKIAEIYQTASQREERAREDAAIIIKSFISNYLEKPKDLEDQFMKYVGKKPLGWLDIAVCRLYCNCKTEKQNT
ncbi:MAG: hypothetical protein RXQ68_03180 [Candidatus Nanopusillus sp.]